MKQIRNLVNNFLRINRAKTLTTNLDMLTVVTIFNSCEAILVLILLFIAPVSGTYTGEDLRDRSPPPSITFFIAILEKAFIE